MSDRAESEPHVEAPVDTPMPGAEDTPALPAPENPGEETAVENPEPEASIEAKEPDPVDLEKLRATFQEKAKTYLIEQSRHVVMPSFARWFDMNTVHSIEKKLFPDFFPTDTDTPASTYKTPETYQNMRDFMINTYRINPIEYLTVTAVRRNLAGDVASIIRIHRFLEKWGIINYQIDPRTKPSLVGPQYTGHFQITLDTPKGLTPFVPEELDVTEGTKPEQEPAPPAQVQTPEVPAEDYHVIPLNMEVTGNIFEDRGAATSAQAVQYICSETSNDVSKVRYHNLKSKGVGGTLGPLEISKEVYDQGLFPLNFVASDFVKLGEAFKHAQWTQQEVLLLLEGVEMFASVDANAQSLFVNSNGQWDRISDHVGSKSREECLVKFLQLPIEDKYLHGLVKKEEAEPLDKDTIIQEVVARLVKTTDGQALMTQNARAGLDDAVVNQTNLINQVIELTLEKVDAKLKLVNHLETDLAKTENLLNLQRKQALVERWLNFEKIAQFKRNNQNPELAALVDDLLTPVSITEINKSFNRIILDTSATSTPAELAQEEILPVSVTQPKQYQFWSA